MRSTKQKSARKHRNSKFQAQEFTVTATYAPISNRFVPRSALLRTLTLPCNNHRSICNTFKYTNTNDPVTGFIIVQIDIVNFEGFF